MLRRIPSPRLTWKLPGPLWKTWFHLQRPCGSFHVSLRECCFWRKLSQPVWLQRRISRGRHGIYPQKHEIRLPEGATSERSSVYPHVIVLPDLNHATTSRLMAFRQHGCLRLKQPFFRLGCNSLLPRFFLSQTNAGGASRRLLSSPQTEPPGHAPTRRDAFRAPMDWPLSSAEKRGRAFELYQREATRGESKGWLQAIRLVQLSFV